MDPLQDKRVPLAWGPLPLQPLLGGRSCSCLGHGEGRRTGKVERPPQTLKGLEEGDGRPKPQRAQKFDHSQHLKRPRRKTWVVTSQHLSASLGPSLAGSHTPGTQASNRQPGQVLFLSP